MDNNKNQDTRDNSEKENKDKQNGDHQDQKAEDSESNKESQKNKSHSKKEIEKKEKKKPTPEEKLKACQKEIDKWKNKFMYLQAEMENSQKISLKRMEAVKYHSKVDAIKLFLPLVESFEGAISRFEKDPELSTNSKDNKYLQGFYQVYNQYKQILKGAGVKPIDKTGVPLDYNEHEVMMKTTDKDKPEDTVVQIIQKGWYLGKKILRPAKVIVSKKPPKPKKEDIKQEKEDIKDSAPGSVENADDENDEPSS